MKTLPLTFLAVFATSLASASAEWMDAIYYFTSDSGWNIQGDFQYDSAVAVPGALGSRAIGNQWPGTAPFTTGLRNFRFRTWSPSGYLWDDEVIIDATGNNRDSFIDFRFDPGRLDAIDGTFFSFGTDSLGTPPAFWIGGLSGTGRGSINYEGPSVLFEGNTAVRLPRGGGSYRFHVPESGETGAMLLGSLTLMGLAARRLRRK